MNLILKKEQIRQFDRQELKNEIDRFIDSICDNSEYSSRFQESEMRTFIKNGISEANSFGIVLEENINKYLTLKLQFGQNGFADQVKENILNKESGEFRKIERLFLLLHSNKLIKKENFIL